MEKYVIFDFDDTLVNNELLDFEGFKRPCNYFGIKPPSKNEISLQRKEGLLAEEIIKNINKKTKKVFSITNFLNYRKNFLSSSESISYLRLKNNIQNLLSFLQKNGVICYLCSVRSNKKLIINFLINNNIRYYFSGIFIPQDFKINIDNRNISNRILIKTSLIKQILKKISSNQIVFIGDSKEDFIAANKFLIKFILLPKHSFKNEFSDNVCIAFNINILKHKLIQLLQLQK